MIVVGVDEREAAADAVAFARSLATDLHEDLLLVWVREPERAPGKLEAILRTPALVQEQIRTAAIEARLRALAAEADSSLPAELSASLRVIADGDPASQLAEVAREEQASTLVVGHPERTGLAQLVGGSTVAKLLDGGSPVPVSVAPRGYAKAPAARADGASRRRDPAAAAA